jgi:hypothetical protein
MYYDHGKKDCYCPQNEIYDGHYKSCNCPPCPDGFVSKRVNGSCECHRVCPNGCPYGQMLDKKSCECRSQHIPYHCRCLSYSIFPHHSLKCRALSYDPERCREGASFLNHNIDCFWHCGRFVKPSPGCRCVASANHPGASCARYRSQQRCAHYPSCSWACD